MLRLWRAVRGDCCVDARSRPRGEPGCIDPVAPWPLTDEERREAAWDQRVWNLPPGKWAGDMSLEIV